jgi:hypothetical protein
MGAAFSLFGKRCIISLRLDRLFYASVRRTILSVRVHCSYLSLLTASYGAMAIRKEPLADMYVHLQVVTMFSERQFMAYQRPEPARA